jgi:Phosphoenolpyruvate carboxykinase (GTP)
VGATMASERTAAQFGLQGEIRRDPMAMLPFCGYNMADYFSHWLNLGKKMAKPPRIFHVNWFRTNSKGKFIWPGFGENLRILEWIISRCNNRVKARETPIGFIPYLEDIDMTGLYVHKKNLEKLFNIDKKQWQKELEQQKEFFSIFSGELPDEIAQEYRALKKRLT